jgi:PHD/YefM family antitoxin component YafN of YafNO toxin-antitoxin module
MLTFSMTSLAHRTTTVTNAADRETVALTHHGKEKYVLMRIEEYEKITQRPADPRQAGSTLDMPEDLQALFLQDAPTRALGEFDLVEGPAVPDSPPGPTAGHRTS